MDTTIRTHCDQCNHEFTIAEKAFYAGITNHRGVLNKFFCSSCTHTSVEDGIRTGSLGWRLPTDEMLSAYGVTRPQVEGILHVPQFLLGASDPEMRRIEEILRESGCIFIYATSNNHRIHPGEAYQADPIPLAEGAHLVLIECEPTSIPARVQVTRIDHHRPGDKGYALPPTQYLEASSLGQLMEFLGITMRTTHNDLILAAMDHCPANAIRGECPMVSVGDILSRKVYEIALTTGESEDTVQTRIDFFLAKMVEAPFITISLEGGMLLDMRELYLGEGYSLDLLAVQTAALISGDTVLLRHRDAVGKPEKWSISGHASPQVIESFIRYWAPSKGLTGIYGVPTRGYAGGYVSATTNSDLGK